MHEMHRKRCHVTRSPAVDRRGMTLLLTPCREAEKKDDRFVVQDQAPISHVVAVGRVSSIRDVHVVPGETIIERTQNCIEPSSAWKPRWTSPGTQIAFHNQ